MEIRFEHVDFVYQAGTAFENKVLNDMNFVIPDQSFTALIGHTGSGKSTILQHFNALNRPTKGQVVVGDFLITADQVSKNIKDLRSKVGIVFQFPEAQLFEETVAKDIAFGPQNFGVSEEDAINIAREMLDVVGLDESFMERSPFDLSGGQMRRVAIAGILAMKPDVLVLDEPTAGLDPKGRQEMMTLFNDLYHQQQLTIVLVTHQMDDVAEYANHVIVLNSGEVAWQGQPRELFADRERLTDLQLGLPAATEFAYQLAEHPEWQRHLENSPLPLTLDELSAVILTKLNQAHMAGETDE